MAEFPVTFSSNQKQLVGMIHTPLKGNSTAVIMCHGFTGSKIENKRLFVEAARSMAAAGFLTFRFDFFGSGDSSGEFNETRISINIQNLRDALTLIRGMQYERIMVLGISMGAATAILTLKEEPVSGLVLWSTVPDMRELFESKLGQSIESVPPKEAYEYDGWLIDREFYLDAIRFDIMGSFEQLQMSKLIVQGSEDDPVITQGFHRFKERKPSNTNLEWIEGAGHTFETVEHRKQVISTTLDWLLEQLK